MKSLTRKATHVVKATEIPTLHRAITAADELRKYLASEDKPTDISSIKPLVLEQFQWESQSQVRVVNTVKWPNRNLQLSRPMDKWEKPGVKKRLTTYSWRRAQPVHAIRCTTLSTLRDAAKLCSICSTDPAAAASDAHLEVTQVNPQAPSEAPTAGPYINSLSRRKQHSACTPLPLISQKTTHMW